MIATGTVTVPAALGEGGAAASGTGSPRSHSFGRHSLTLPRPGEQRKGACPAAGPAMGDGGFKASRSHLSHAEAG